MNQAVTTANTALLATVQPRRFFSIFILVILGLVDGI